MSSETNNDQKIDKIVAVLGCLANRPAATLLISFILNPVAETHRNKLSCTFLALTNMQKLASFIKYINVFASVNP